MVWMKKGFKKTVRGYARNAREVRRSGKEEEMVENCGRRKLECLGQ